MNLPTFYGSLEQNSFYIYTACDEHYFDEFAEPLINSIQANTDLGIHIHIFNPRQDQIDYCNAQPRVSVSYERISVDRFALAAHRLELLPPTYPEHARTLTAMSKGNDKKIQERMQKTYFACARFARLAHMFNGVPVLAIDIDALVRKPIPQLDSTYDLYIHRIIKKDPRFLAGGLYINSSGGNFLTEYSNALIDYIRSDHLYWSLDQDVLESIVPKYRWEQLPMSLIDWNMNASSCIWTAKGTRKELDVFIAEKKKYTVVLLPTTSRI
jgi:hypothetical protein